MKYFLILFITGIILEQCLELIYRHTNRYRISQGGTENFRKGVPSELEIVNIGSGPGLYAISYEYSNNSGFNLSTAPQSYKYGFRLLKRYKDHIKNGAIIIIIIMCPLSFAWVRGTDKPGYSDKFYGILPKEDIDQYTRGREFALKWFPLLTKVVSKIQTMNIKQITKKANKDELPIVVHWKDECKLQDLKNPRQAKEHKRAFMEKVQIIKNGIDFCLENNWRPIFVIPPVPRLTKKFISDEFVNVFVRQNLQKIRLEYPDIPLLDYYVDDRFTDDMFQDDIFMNKKGQAIFSQILFKDVQELEC